MNNFWSKFITALIVFFLFLWAGKYAFAVNYPQPKGFVNDFAEVLSPDVEQKLEEKLASYRTNTTNEIAVVTVKSLEGLEVEQYSIGLADLWKVGDKEKDNGIIFLVSSGDRKIRIEVGYGLEGELTDLESGRIIREVVAPSLKAGNYDEGITRGVEAIVASLDAQETVATASATTDDGVAILIVVILVIALVIILIAISPFTPIGGQGTWGITSGYSSSGGSFFSSGGSSSSGGFGGFSGGGFGGGGSSGSF